MDISPTTPGTVMRSESTCTSSISQRARSMRNVSIRLPRKGGTRPDSWSNFANPAAISEPLLSGPCINGCRVAPPVAR